MLVGRERDGDGCNHSVRSWPRRRCQSPSVVKVVSFLSPSTLAHLSPPCSMTTISLLLGDADAHVLVALRRYWPLIRSEKWDGNRGKKGATERREEKGVDRLPSFLPSVDKRVLLRHQMVLLPSSFLELNSRSSVVPISPPPLTHSSLGVRNHYSLSWGVSLPSRHFSLSRSSRPNSLFHFPRPRL